VITRVRKRTSGLLWVNAPSPSTGGRGLGHLHRTPGAAQMTKIARSSVISVRTILARPSGHDSRVRRKTRSGIIVTLQQHFATICVLLWNNDAFLIGGPIKTLAHDRLLRSANRARTLCTENPPNSSARKPSFSCVPDLAGLCGPHRKEWLLAIGQRLRAEYDALAQPLPLHLLALVKQLDQTPIKESGQYVADVPWNEPACAGARCARGRSEWRRWRTRRAG
jgi:hypothetical protein